MFVAAEAATTLVRLDGRFDPPQALSLQQVLSMSRPAAHVVIDFGKVRDVDDAAVASLARALGELPASRVTFRGLSRHLRRVLRYVGIHVDGAAAPRALPPGSPDEG